MGAPEVTISFTEKSATFIKRGERGTVLLLVKDTIPDSKVNPVTILLETDIPSIFSEETKEQIKLALKGYIHAPQKVLVYGMGIEEGDSEEEITEKYRNAFQAIESIKFQYLVCPTVKTDGKTQDIVSWVKLMRGKKSKKIKAVLPNTAADFEGIINYTTEENKKEETIIQEDGTKTIVETIYTAEEYCSRIAGLIAGTPLTMSCTYAPLSELADCTHLEDMNEAVDKGEFILFYDGEKVKTVRAVNSLVTLTTDKGKSFKKIKIVEGMDMINDDIRKTIEDDYVGKYNNTYDNKCILLTTIKQYLEGLKKAGVVSSYEVEIDLEKQRQYLEANGVDTSDMSEEEIRQAETGEKVFLSGRIKILDAMEDIYLPILI